jgi:hypothetical protein
MYKIKMNVKGCKDITELKDFIRRNNINLILFAETHGYLKEILVQREVIKHVKPDFYLYEMLEESKISNDKDAKKLLDKSDREEFSFISTYGDLKPTIKLARSFNLPIVGCDIKNMCVKTKNWINEKYSKNYWNTITKKRETGQAKVINRYVKRGLVFASLGAYHLRKDSIVLKGLKQRKFIIVHPLFEGKEKFLIPRDQKRSNVSFGIKLVQKDQHSKRFI